MSFSLSLFRVFCVRRGLLLSLGIAAAVTTISRSADATITISGVSNASNYVVSTSLDIFGGSAGMNASNIPVTLTEPYNTCANPPATAPLFACNDRAIRGDINLSITFRTDKGNGIPILFYVNNSTNQVISSNTETVFNGNDGTITLAWSEICSALALLNGGMTVPSSCIMPTDLASGTFKLGFSADGQASNLIDSMDVKIYVTGAIGQGPSSLESTVNDCDDANAVGLCHFEIAPGDSRVGLRTLRFVDRGTTGGSALKLNKLRVLWTDSVGGFADITSASAHADRDLDTTDGGSLPNARIEGLTNDRLYYFKVATMDEAGNVGYYTSAAADTYCALTSNPAATDCHQAIPGEVVGVLKSDVKCFIATAAFDSPLAPTVKTLRQFRDAILIPHSLGRSFVDWYYDQSPKYARIIQQSPILKTLTRLALLPLIAYAWLALHLGALAALAVYGSLLGLLILSLRFAKRSSRVVSLLICIGCIGAPFTTTAATDPDPAAAATAIDPSATASSEEDELPPIAEPPYPGSEEAEFAADPSAVSAIDEITPSERPRKIDDEGVYHYSTTMNPPRFSGQKGIEPPSRTDKDESFSYPLLKSPPQPKVRDGIEAPLYTTVEGEYQYRMEERASNASASIRFGIITPPTIRNADNGATFKQLYGDASLPVLLGDYERRLTSIFGRLSVKVGSGLVYANGEGRFRNTRNTRPEERFNFFMFPNQITAIYKFQYAEKQVLVPFVEGGGGYFVIAEIRDDLGKKRFAGVPVGVAAGGVNLLLNWLDPTAIRQLDADYGINHLWLTAEVRQVVTSDLIDVSSTSLNAGFVMEF